MCFGQVYVSPSALYQKTRTGISGGGGGVVGRTGEWVDVPSGSEQPFDFSSNGKMRHRVSEMFFTTRMSFFFLL